MAMFDRLGTRAEAKARAAAEAILSNVEAMFAVIPNAQLRIAGDTLVIEARGLARRWLNDARLRFGFWRGG